MSTQIECKHVIMDSQNQEMRCEHCGAHLALRLPMPIDEFVTASENFIKAHADCKESKMPPQPDAPSRIEVDDFIIGWLANGHRGTSSNTIVQYMTGLKTLQGYPMSHPYDPSDLSRCRKLLEQCPSIRENFQTMKTCSPIWSSLVECWDELCELMDLEAPEWDKGKGSAPKTYDFMKKLGC